MRPRQHNGKPLGLNAIGKPYSESFDPNYRLRFRGTKINRLRKPYGPGMWSPDDQHKRKRRRKPRPTPLLDLMQEGRES
jgi:hypothetical protein